MTSPTSDTAVPREKNERSVNVRGIETHLFEGGSPDAPPLLYLHGTMLGNLWLEYHQRLAARFHLFAPDTPGFGLSQRPDWMRDMSDYVLYFRDLLDTLGLEQPIVVGHSLGGWMAVEMAVWFPERVSKLVLSNAVGIRVKGSPLGHLFAMNPQELFAAVFDDPAAGAPLIPAEMSYDYIIDQFRQRTTLAALAWNPHYDPKLERRLERLQAPTLVIWGANDRLVPAVYGERYQQLIAGAKLVTLQGTGHMPMFEQPARWSEEITTFLLAE